MLNRFFTADNDLYIQEIFASVSWTKVHAEIKSPDGTVLFDQWVDFPDDWSQNSINIVASKYFKTIDGVKEDSLQQLITRVVTQINTWGQEFGYFRDKDSMIFMTELTYILLNQFACFNSPVWFNLGVPGRDPQVSACFLLDVEDNMESILEHGVTEGIIFKGGSGAGINISKLRGEGEPLSAGGTSSGPMSFVRGWDKMAGAIKSGGTTRRAARLVVMDADHQDIWDFVESKVREEAKARVLVEAGYSDAIDGEAYDTVAFQNANHSVMVTDDFMSRAVEDDFSDESSLLDQIAAAAWKCGDPGLLFFDAINRWNPTPKAGDIRTANPCCEFLHQPFTSCNLSSLNLTKYIFENDKIDLTALGYVSQIMALAQDITIQGASFPTPRIKEQTLKFRPIGLGFTDLGGLLMTFGIPYDSKTGQTLAGLIQSTITASAFAMSAKIATRLAPFPSYSKHHSDLFDVVQRHKHYATELDLSLVEKYTTEDQRYQFTRSIWDLVLGGMNNHGLRNSYVTNIAPTGTISFFMGSSTTGIEPSIALKAQKSFVGGGSSILVNSTVTAGLRNLGYDEETIDNIVTQILDGESVYSPQSLVLTKDRSVFLTALDDSYGNALSPYSHIEMVAAVQPFLSGGVSKTVNCPSGFTVGDIRKVYIKAWRDGLKAVSIYRDNSKVNQPVRTIKMTVGGEQKPTFEWSEPNPATETQNIPFSMKGSFVPIEPLPITAEVMGAGGTDVDKPGVTFHQTEDGGREWKFTTAPYDGTNNPEDIVIHMDEQLQDTSDEEKESLPDNLDSIRHKFTIGQTTGYIHIGYHKKRAVEVFINVARDGSTLSGLCNTIGILISSSLQAGVSVEELKSRLADIAFEPRGMTRNKEIRFTSSIVDYVVRLLEIENVKIQNSIYVDNVTHRIHIPVTTQGSACPIGFSSPDTDSPLIVTPLFETEEEQVSRWTGDVCQHCGGQMVTTGTCSTCMACGEQGGCS